MPKFGAVEFGVKLGGRCIPKTICLLAKGCPGLGLFCVPRVPIIVLPFAGSPVVVKTDWDDIDIIIRHPKRRPLELHSRHQARAA